MLGLKEKLELDSILDLAKWMMGRKRRRPRPFVTETDFKNGMEARRRLQERFGMYFPAPNALLGVTPHFCLAAGGTTKAYGLLQTAKPTPVLTREVFAFVSAGRFGGVQPFQEKRTLVRKVVP
jgi:hypothetical protein